MLLFGSWTEQSSEGKAPDCLRIAAQGQVCVCAQGMLPEVHELLSEIPMCAGIAK